MASTLKDIQIDYLGAKLTGELITFDDPGYDDARTVFFKGVDRHPLAVAPVADAEDVSRVVSFAREGGVELAVRSGGHSRAGHGTSEGGIVSEYTATTGERGLVTGLGDTGSVGIGGITLAGGIGFLVRKNGLTIDDLLAADVVTAGGQLVRASESSEPDLFWAIRGGEGDFGVVTHLQLRLHEVSQIVGGMLILPATPEVITGFLEAAGAAPQELSTIANVTLAPPMRFIPEEAHGQPILIGQMACVGPVERGEAVLGPFRALAKPYADMVRPMRYPELYKGPEHAVRFGSGANFFSDSLPLDGAAAIVAGLHAPRRR